MTLFETGGIVPAPEPTPWITNRWLRTGAVLWIVLTPAISFPFSGMFAPEWQSGRVGGVAGIALGSTSLGPFFAIVVAAIAVAAIALMQPRFASLWPVRLGLYLAAAIAFSYAIALGIATTGLSVGLTALFIVVGVLPARAIYRGWRFTPVFLWLVGGLAVFSAILSLVLSGDIGGFFSPLAVVLVFAVASGPVICLAIVVTLLRDTSSPPIPVWGPLVPVVMLVGMWRQGLVRSIEVYNELPTSAPNCYIATAAASGHAGVVGSSVGRHGVPVNKQLQTFKAGEIVLASTLPGAHKLIRRIYDHIGPRMARRLGSAWLSDLAFVLLLPLEAVTRLLLRVLVPRSSKNAVLRLYR